MNKYNVFILCVLCSLFIGCKKIEVQDNIYESIDKGNQIKNIIIEFYPCFHESSIVFFDMRDNTALFKSSGFIYSIEGDSAHEEYERELIKPISYKLDKINYSFLKDSIQFTDDDFVNMKDSVAIDGISLNVIYLFEDGKMIDIDLVKSWTNNHQRLIELLIDGAIASNPEDKFTNDYFHKLKSFFRRDLI